MFIARWMNKEDVRYKHIYRMNDICIIYNKIASIILFEEELHKLCSLKKHIYLEIFKLKNTTLSKKKDCFCKRIFIIWRSNVIYPHHSGTEILLRTKKRNFKAPVIPIGCLHWFSGKGNLTFTSVKFMCFYWNYSVELNRDL